MISFIIGSCKLTFTSPLPALILLNWFYGVDPSMTYEDYKYMYIQANGPRVDFVEKCFLEYPVIPLHFRNQVPEGWK